MINKLFATFLIVFILFSHNFIFGQNKETDSLKNAFKIAKHDTVKCNILVALIESENDENIWSNYNESLFLLAKKNIDDKTVFDKRFKKYLAEAFNNKGYIYCNLGETKNALENISKSLNLYKEVNYKVGVANALNSIAYVYQMQGDIIRSLEFYHQSLKLQEENNDESGKATSLTNLAYIYSLQGDSEKALEYYNNCLVLQIKVNDEAGVATTYNNIGVLYYDLHQFDKALKCYKKSLAVYTKINDKSGMAATLNNLGKIYEEENDKENAFNSYYKSLKLEESIGHKKGQISSLNNIAILKALSKDFVNAKEYANKALVISKEIGFPDEIRESAAILKSIYQKTNRYKEAFKMYELEIQMRDSINNQENRKSMLKKQLQYEYNQKEKELKLEQDKKDIITQKEKQTQKVIIFAVTFGFVIALVFGLFVFRSYRQKHKANIIISEQKEQVERQKHIIEETQKEITDSINYAKRIQTSFMASKQELDSKLKNYFLFFKPKDVVSGDFYWANYHDNKFYLCIADSTGHGIPGAFMSLLNISLLNEGLLSKNLVKTSDILNFVRKILILGIKADEAGHGGKDGMDCSLMCFDFENLKLSYSAANNPIWIVRNNLNGVVELIDLKPDKMPVGKHDNDTIPFSQHEIQLYKGDLVYALTDGFPDQFGGPKNKKFMSKNLKELLISNYKLPMDEQYDLLESIFKNWIEGVEQIDDVTLIGIRV